ncbi:MAG: hypothetical protein KC589_03075 [Nanoarchaeota archaeon]|nr:hypothetical protein [Nanoarchaeota archaeon]MCA9495900.1 hypothetical protein [Nanoarchaeota archaeon]
MLSAGGETLVKMEVADAIFGKPIKYYPSVGSNGTGMQIQSLDVNKYLETKGLQSVIKSN